MQFYPKDEDGSQDWSLSKEELSTWLSTGCVGYS